MAENGGGEDRVSNIYSLTFFFVETIEFWFNSRGFEKDPKSSKFEIVAKVPLDIIKGKYTINGKLLVLPLQGTGDLEIKHSKESFSSIDSEAFYFCCCNLCFFQND